MAPIRNAGILLIPAYPRVACRPPLAVPGPAGLPVFRNEYAFAKQLR